MKGIDGEVLDTEQVAERWRSHFAEQEDGLPVTPEQLIDLNDASQRQEAVLPRWDQLPTLAEVEQALRNTAGRKAFLCRWVPGDVLRQLPSLFAPFCTAAVSTVSQRDGVAARSIGA